MKKLILGLMLMSAAVLYGQGQDDDSISDIPIRLPASTVLGTITSIDFANSLSALITLSGAPCGAGACVFTLVSPNVAAKQFWRSPRSGAADGAGFWGNVFPDDIVTSPADDDMIQVQGGLFAKSSPGTTTELADVTTGAESAGTSDKWARADHVHHMAPPTQRVNFTILSPGAAENFGGAYFTSASTITKGHCVLQGSSTPSVTPDFRYGTDRSAAGTAVMTTPSAITSTTTGTDITLNNTAIPSSGWLWLTTTAQSGTVTALICTVEYTTP